MASAEDSTELESKVLAGNQGLDDKYSVEAAEFRANEALRFPISEAAPIYEHLLTVFPTAAKYWKQYVEAHMAVNNDDATKHIFSRCLLNCLQVPLWRCYIKFIRNVNDKKGVEGQEETRKAFDFMLSYVGADIASGPVWMEYIAFLKQLPASNAQEESLRMIAVRKAYQKAIVIPTHHIEQLWKDYENFENSVSRQLAKGLISEYQPKFNSARAVYRERKKYVDEIDWNMLAIPPTGSYKATIFFSVVGHLLFIFISTIQTSRTMDLFNVPISSLYAFDLENKSLFFFFFFGDFPFIREPNERELGEVLELLGCLDGVRLSESISDRWLWELEGRGLFSSKSFFKFMIDDHFFPTFKFCHLHPTKAEVFNWLLASSKLNTKEMLQRRKPCLHLSPG